MSTSIKQQLYNHCIAYASQRVEAAQSAIHALQQSANEESKSSVGDKYETGRAMMQLEIEKHSAQLAESLKLKKVVDQIKPDRINASAQQGSLVITDNGNFYLAISVGKFKIDGKEYMIISPGSPIGQKIIGHNANETFSFHNKIYKILEIL